MPKEVEAVIHHAPSTESVEMRGAVLAAQRQSMAVLLNTGRNEEKRVRPTSEDAEITGDPASVAGTHRDTECGVLGCYPPCLTRHLARIPPYFTALFMLLLVQGVMKSYITGMLTTIERRFDLNSQQLGVIIIMDNIGNLGTILFMAHFGGKAKRPLVMGLGMIVTSVGAFIMTVPHYVFGAGPADFTETGSSQLYDPYVCNLTAVAPSDGGECHELQATDTEGTQAHAIICLGFMLVGGGGAGLYSLGVSYLDDNVDRKKAPILIGIVYTGRFMGPVFGYLVFSAFSRIFIDLNNDPGITESDPRWVGAWWLGLLIISMALFCTSLPMLCFPRYMPHTRRKEMENKLEDSHVKQSSKPEDSLLEKLKGFLSALVRLIKNPVYMLMSLAVSADLWSVAAVFSFQPKYIQNQFGISASDASLYGGTTGLTGVVIGSIVGGYVIKRFHLQPKGASVTCIFGTAAFGIGCIAMLFLGCPNRNYPGSIMDHSGQWNFTESCNSNCRCSPTLRFSPVCRDGVTYFTPCHAGCSGTLNVTENGETRYTDCSCVPGDQGSTNSGQYAVEGFCPEDDCSDTLNLYLALLFFSVSLGGIAAVGGILVKLRCVAVEDKPLALGFSSFLYSFFGFIPAPIVIGSLIDSSCTYWSLDACGEEGACWIYDNDRFRYYIYGCGVVVKAISMPLYALGMWKCPGPWRHRETSGTSPPPGAGEGKEMDEKTNSHGQPVDSSQGSNAALTSKSADVGLPAKGRNNVTFTINENEEI